MINKKIIVTTILILFIPITYAQTKTLSYYSVIPAKLNIRIEPNKESNVVGFAYKYQKIDAIEVKNGWAKIHRCNILLNQNINTCWVSINYLFPVITKQLRTTSKIVKPLQAKQQKTILSLIVLSIFLMLSLFLYILKRTIIKEINKQNSKNKNQPTENNNSIINDALSTQILEIKNQLNALQNYSFENKEKIKRFENGYDWKVQKEFVVDIINSIEYLEKQNKKENNDDLSSTIEDLNIMLENNGIYKVELNFDNYKGQEIMAKVISTELTNDASKNDAIKEILKNGYYIEINEMKKIIKPAEVLIYKTKER